MRIGVVAFAASLFLISNSSAGSPQSPITPMSSPQAATLLAQSASDGRAITLLHASLSAMMGSATSVPNAMIASGFLTRPRNDNTAPYPARIYMRNMDEFRWEEDLPEGSIVTVINGNAAQLQSVSKTDALRPWEVGGNKLENFPMFLLARLLNSNSLHASFVSLEAVQEQRLYHLSIIDLSQRIKPLNPLDRDENRGRYELYLDPTTFLPQRLRYYQETDDTNFFSLLPVDVVYFDFRPTNGFNFPFSITRYVDDKELSVLQLKSVQPNGSVGDQQFEIK